MDAPEVDAEFLTLAAPVQGVTARLSPPFDLTAAEPGCALAVGNRTGWAVAVHAQQGLSLFSLASLRSCLAAADPHSTPEVQPITKIPTTSPVDFVRFAYGESLVIAGLRDGSVVVWTLEALVAGNVSVQATLPATAPGPLLDLCPNPAPDSALLAVLSSTAPLALYDLSDASRPQVTATLPTRATAACWSVKGKQLAVGLPGSGQIAQFTPQGEQKAVLARPADLGGESEAAEDAYEVRSLEWLENHVFLVTYARPRTVPGSGVEPQHEDEVYVLTRAGDGSVSETKFGDPAPPFGMMERQGRRWIGRFRSWEPFQHLLFMASAPSGDIAVLAQQQDPAATYPPGATTNTGAGGWVTLALPETCRPTLPLGPEGNDVCPLALELDLSATEEKDGSGQPAVLVYTSEGVLAYWRVGNDKAPQYPGMITVGGVPASSTTNLAPAGSVTSSSAPTANPTATPSPFGAGSSAPSPFAAQSTASPFGSTAPSTAAPAFGATSAFGAFAAGPSTPSAATPSASSSSPFATSTPATGGFANVPASGGFAAFGAPAASSTPTSTSGFSSPSGAGTAFGTSGAAASKSGPVFGSTSAFGSGAGGSGGGFAGFGSGSGFGSGAGAGGFGAFGGKSAFAAPASSSSSGTPAFPKAPTTSAFASAAGAASSPSSSSKPAFSFAPTSLSTSARGRGARGSDEEDGEMSDDHEDEDEGATGRADEPPDLDPTRTGLALAESMREAAAQRKNQPSAASGLEGLGGLGLGGAAAAAPTSASAASTTPATTTASAAGGFSFAPSAAAGEAKPSVFGSGGSAFGIPSAPSASSSSKPATAAPTFGSSTSGFGAFASGASSGTATPAPAFGQTSAFGAGKPASPAFGAAATTSTPTTSSTSAFGKPAFGSSGFGSFASATPGSGGFGAFAAAAKPKEKDQAGPSAAMTPTTAATEPAKSAFGAGGFAGFAAPAKAQEATKSEVKSTEPEEEEIGEKKKEEAPADKTGPSVEEGAGDASVESNAAEAKVSPAVTEASTKEAPKPAFSFAPAPTTPAAMTEKKKDNDDKPAFSFAPATTAPSSSTPAASDAKPAPAASAFGAFGSGAAGTAFPKPASPGGFGAFASSSSSSPGGFGFGFGSASKSAGSPSTAGSTGFSFGSSSASPTTAAPTGFSFAPAAKPGGTASAFGSGGTATPAVDVPAPASSQKDASSSTKSLFGFASSPPEERKRADVEGSLLSRLGGKVADDNDDDEEDNEEDEGEEVDEEDDDDEDAEPEEDEDEYSEEQDEEEEGTDDEDQDQEAGNSEEEQNEQEEPAARPSLLSRLSPAPPSPAASEPSGTLPHTQTPLLSLPGSPASTPSASPSTAQAKVPFSFAPSAPASPSPATAFSPPATPVAEGGPAATKTPTSFLNFASSAPKTSSPLAAPPLAVPSFTGFGKAAPKVSSPLAQKDEGPTPKPAFSFAPQTETSKPSTPTASAPLFAGFGGFGAGAASSAAKPEAAHPAAGAPKPTPAPSFSFGAPAATGMTKPAETVDSGSGARQADAAKSADPSFGSGALPISTEAADNRAPSPSSSVTSSSALGRKEVPAAEPAPAKVQQSPLVSGTAPKVGARLVAAGNVPVPRVEEKGMSGEFLRAYLSVQKDLETLRDNAVELKAFTANLRKPCQPASEADSISYETQDWSFGDLDKLRDLTRSARPGVESLHAAALAQKKRIVELQSLVLKAETKREEAARYIRAREDPAVAKMVRMRQLGPEQSENQRRIRLQVEAVRTKIEQLEEHMLNLKDKLSKEKQGRGTLKAPSLDSVSRAMRNITVAASEKAHELDTLASRIDRLRIQPRNAAASRNAGSMSSRALDEALDHSTTTPATRKVSKATPTASATATAKAALTAERSASVLKRALLAVRATEPLVNQSACSGPTAGTSSPVADLRSAFAAGPVTRDRIPQPRRYTPPRPVSPPLALSPPPAFTAVRRVISPSPMLPSPTPGGFDLVSSQSSLFKPSALGTGANAPVTFPKASGTASPLPAFSPAPTGLSSTPPASLAPVFAPSGSSASLFAQKPTSAPGPSLFTPSPLSTPSASSTVTTPLFTSSAGPQAFENPAAPDLTTAPSPAPTASSQPSAGGGPPALTFKAMPSFQFAQPVAPSIPSGDATGSSPGVVPRGSSRQGLSRAHSSAVALKPAGPSATPSPASSFDWGPLPAAATPSKPASTMPGFVSLSSPAATDGKPKGFSFGSSTPGSTTPIATPTKAPPSFSFGALSSDGSAGFSTTPTATPKGSGNGAPFSFGAFGKTASSGTQEAKPESDGNDAQEEDSDREEQSDGLDDGASERGDGESDEWDEEGDDAQDEGHQYDDDEEDEDEDGLSAIAERTEEEGSE